MTGFAEVMVYSNNHYNKSLKGFARANRNSGTKAEIRLWTEVLNRRQMLGYQFLRQRPIDKFIADFFCKELKLVIETDGYTHQLKEAYEKDQRREQRLKELGYCILRFRDEDVMNNIARVKEMIAWKIHEIKKSSP
ncbi:MAG: endonuclease domain-containing protein [Bacteroidota bacterium]